MSAVHEARRGLRALYAEVPAVVARDVQRRVEAALKEVWEEGMSAGYDVGVQHGDGQPAPDPVNPYPGVDE